MTTVAERLKDMPDAEVAALRRAKRKEVEREIREVRRELDAEERQAATTAPPEPLTLRERLARPRPLARWRIDGLQAVGHRVLLAAQFKAGKTTLAANVARSLLDGDSFLGRDVHGIDGAVSLFDFEMNDAQLDAWYADQHIANDDRLVVFPMRGAASSFDILNHDVRAGWVATLKARHVRYLILDCLRPVLDALGLNEHTQVGLFLTALDALLREAGIPEALVIQHMGHKGERARGDSRLLDWPDVGWTLVRTDDDDPASPRYFKAYGRDVDVPETQLTYDEASRRLAIGDVDMTRHNAKTEAALMAICKFLDGGEVQSGKQIEAALAGNGVTRDAIRKALRHGLECGALVEEEGGRGGGKRYRSTVGARPDFLPLEHGGHAG